MTSDTELLEAAQRVDRGSIVVGHDGSPGADQALEEALVLARALGVALVVVRAWSLLTAPRQADWDFGYVPGYDECAEIVRRALVDDAGRAGEGYPEVSVTCHAVHASPTQSLVEVSRRARMLVVGARGVGGLAGMLLGSVSDQCVRHAHCSVLVARTPD